MDLFDHHRETLALTSAPLAARLRPRRLEDFIGQEHIVGQGRLLRRAIAADQLSSLIFYGPPGTGKTTLAQIIANSTKAHFIAINAVLAGVKQIRAAIAEAQDRRGQQSQCTILFVDEVHRFNKAQQDALLPWVENGTIVLIGATTENPYFEVNKALVSRSRLFQLRSLETSDLEQVIERALTDPYLGYGQKDIVVDRDAQMHLINVANGDARALLNALELAVETTEPDDSGQQRINLEVAEESIQKRAVLYDKEGDAHFDTISAFIKSIRGSDPDAALYWLARMIYSGEDPRFIFRRLIILASEDIGLADPQAVGVVTACANAFDRIGMPEGQYPLAQATLYLSNTTKSNSTLGYFEALKAVERERAEEVPNALKDNNRDAKSFGHGANYKYPHAYRDHWVAQQYLPKGLQGQAFYQPSNQGWERSLAIQVEQRREAQIAALAGGDMAVPEVLSFGPVDSKAERWLQRAVGQSGERLGDLRDRLFELAQCQRHHLVLDARARTGLLTWEAVRQVPEGQVYACTTQEHQKAQLEQQALSLPELRRPRVFTWPRNPNANQSNNHQSNNHQSSQANAPSWGAEQPVPWDDALRFERIIGRNVLSGEEQIGKAIEMLAQQLSHNGKLILVESIPSQGQRLYEWIESQWLSKELLEQLKSAEETLYQEESSLCWDAATLRHGFTSLGLQASLEIEPSLSQIQITAPLIQHWFGERPQSYASRLGAWLSAPEIKRVRSVFEQHLLGQQRAFQGAIAWIVAQR